MINLHTAELESVTHSDALAWVDASAVETQRVDFKECLPEKLDTIVELCCAFANAYGGIIVLGFADPDKTNGILTPTALALDLSDRTLLRLDNSLVDRIRPGIRFDVARFPKRLNEQIVPKFAILRVSPSPVAPHEVIPQHIFPVRRDRRVHRLGLPEIEAMLRSRDGLASSKDRWTRVPEVSLVQYGPHLADLYGSHIGVTISPVDAHLADFEHSRHDDDFVMAIMRRLKTERKLELTPEENGAFVSEAGGDLAERTKAPFTIVLTGTGYLSARLRIGYRKQFTRDVEDLGCLLATVYNLGARYYRRKRFGSTVRIRVAIVNVDKTSRLISILPDVHDLSTDIDLYTNFPSAVGRLVERLWRSAGSNPNPAAVESLLGAVWEGSFKVPPSDRPWSGD